MKPGLLLVLAVCAGAQDRVPARRLPNPARVSGESPFSADCDGAQTGRHYRNAAVETWVAADPQDPLHLVGVWQQDRWSNGGASGLLAGASFDGGLSWTRSTPAFSKCSGGNVGYLRASDPWVTISPGGAVYAISLSLTASNAGQAILVSRSLDGGLHWDDPLPLIQDQLADVSDDKESITADPLDPNYVYAVWDRLEGLTSTTGANFRGPVWFSRTANGGATWERARLIFDPGRNAQTIGNQIVVLPDGTLVDVFAQVLNATAPLVRDERLSIALIRSLNHGITWSAPITVAEFQPVGVSDVKTGTPIRSAVALPAVAVDSVSGALYVTWQDGRFSAGQREGIALARSLDGGLTWSAPAQINQVPEVQAFTPAIAVAGNGEVAVTYYDFRKDNEDRAVLLTSYWRLISGDGGRSWSEAPLAEPFDLAAAPVTDGAGLFIGDYQGLVAAGDRFLSFFVVSNAGDVPSEVFAVTRPSGADRSHNGHTEVNRFVLRRRVELGKKRK